MGSPGLKVKRLCDGDRNFGGMSGNLFKIKGLFEDNVCKKSRSEIKIKMQKLKLITLGREIVTRRLQNTSS